MSDDARDPGMSSAPDPRTALIVRTPEAESRVGPLRARFDPSAALGVPAHVTLLHPCMAPASVDAGVRPCIAAIAAASAAFDHRLEEIRRFPGTLYLTPIPAALFVALTRARVAAFPAWLPYGGRHASVIPHLRAHANAVENLVVFAALVLAAQAAGVSNAATASACVVSFWAHVVHVGAYTAAVPWLRTLAFTAGFLTQATLAWQLLMR